MIKKFDKFLENAGATTGVVGSGTAVGGGAGSGDMGSFTSASGQAVYGGDSGSAFATNSNTAGMGAIKSSQPSNIPGDVAGSTPGSGDIGGKPFGAFTKTPAGRKRKKRKDKKNRDYTKAGEHIDNFYTTKYTESHTNGEMITSWEAFTEKKVYEEINWSKQPWKFLKNILQLEEPEIEEVGDFKDDDIVELKTTLRVSVSNEISYTVDAIEKLAKVYKLEGSVTPINNSTIDIKLRGKKKLVDIFYENLSDSIN